MAWREDGGGMWGGDRRWCRRKGWKMVHWEKMRGDGEKIGDSV